MSFRLESPPYRVEAQTGVKSYGVGGMAALDLRGFCLFFLIVPVMDERPAEAVLSWPKQ